MVTRISSRSLHAKRRFPVLATLLCIVILEQSRFLCLLIITTALLSPPREGEEQKRQGFVPWRNRHCLKYSMPAQDIQLVPVVRTVWWPARSELRNMASRRLGSFASDCGAPLWDTVDHKRITMGNKRSSSPVRYNASSIARFRLNNIFTGSTTHCKRTQLIWRGPEWERTGDEARMLCQGQEGWFV